jgi:hypothetical protein
MVRNSGPRGRGAVFEKDLAQLRRRSMALPGDWIGDVSTLEIRRNSNLADAPGTAFPQHLDTGACVSALLIAYPLFWS